MEEREGSTSEVRNESILEILGLPEMLTQLAEEAAELSKAALKYRRALTGDNPTPVTPEEALENLYEEISDLNMVIEFAGIREPIGKQMQRWSFKSKRWKGRLNANRLKYLASSDIIDPKSRETVPPVAEHDPVNHPSHYTAGGVECLDAIRAALTGYQDAFRGFLAGQIIKYVWRSPLKNGLEDLKKARFYLDRMIQETEKESAEENKC